MKKLVLALSLSSALGLGACADPTANQTLAGGAIGAASGAVIGGLAGDAALGAGIGGAVGLAGGFLSTKYKVVPR